MNRRLIPLLLAVAAGLLTVPTAAPAAVNIRVGIGDQNSSMFLSEAYQELKLKRTRYFIPWNAIDDDDQLEKADNFVAFARASKVNVLMHISTENLAAKKGRLPGAKTYAKKVKALVKRYRPKGVKEWGVWNEVNHNTQPTYKNPKRAAQYYFEMRKFCKGCAIVALDVLDQRGVESYVRRWLKAAGSRGRRATIIGIHNYSEVNRRIKKGTKKYPGTGRIIRAVQKQNRRARFWYTETGGLASFGTSFPCSESRQSSRTSYMFTLAKRYKKYIRRLYTYNWTGTDCTNRFDAGIVRLDGSTRPSYDTFKRRLKGFKR